MAAASPVKSLQKEATCPVGLEYFSAPVTQGVRRTWSRSLPASYPQRRDPRQQHMLLPRAEPAQEYEKQTQAERQKIVAEFQQLRQFLEEQERLLLVRLEKLNEEIGNLKTDTVRKLSVQISHLSERISELEGTCQKPASEFVQDARSRQMSRCETGPFQPPEEISPELDERVRGFTQQTNALSETLGVFTVTSEHEMAEKDRNTPSFVLLSAETLSTQTPRLTAIVTLDPDTAHPDLVLSKDRKRVRWEHARQRLPDNPERFDSVYCVLGREGFTSGRHWWEVEVGDGKDWAVGVARESVSRKGRISRSPEEGIWAVQWWGGFFQALTDPEVTPLELSPPRRIRVCLDCDQGQVTFIDAGADAPIFTFPEGSLPGERIRPWFCVGFKSQLRLSLRSASLGLTQPSL